MSGIIAVCSLLVSLYMSPTRSGYKELGLKIINPLKDDPRQTRQPHMEEEMKYEGVGDPIKSLLQEALA